MSRKINQSYILGALKTWYAFTWKHCDGSSENDIKVKLFLSSEGRHSPKRKSKLSRDGALNPRYRNPCPYAFPHRKKLEGNMFPGDEVN